MVLMSQNMNEFLESLTGMTNISVSLSTGYSAIVAVVPVLVVILALLMPFVPVFVAHIK
jgi:hypothetical protein